MTRRLLVYTDTAQVRPGRARYEPMPASAPYPTYRIVLRRPSSSTATVAYRAGAATAAVAITVTTQLRHHATTQYHPCECTHPVNSRDAIRRSLPCLFACAYACLCVLMQAPIRMEQLKGLVRKWKLHHERNFWRNHPSTEDVVNACHKHLKEKRRCACC